MISMRLGRSALIRTLGVFIIGFGMVFLQGCSREQEQPTTLQQPDEFSRPQEVVLSKANPQVRATMTIQERNTGKLMEHPDIVGTATGLNEKGELAILVFTVKPLGRTVIPEKIEGIPVVEEVTGIFRALKGKPGGGGGTKVDHRAKQTPPIELGTSGGWGYDLANGYCCGGTLGALVTKGGVQYILSNYHVFESDIVSGGNGRVATTGDPIIQPGLIDVKCDKSKAQNVATLVVSSSLPNNNVDAAIAQIISGMVKTDGSILEIGVISKSTTSAYLKQAVKKSGRTTGLTRSKVTGLNATVSVSYDNECAGGTAFTKTFTGQIILKNNGSRFLAGGDSGSLLVEDTETTPKAVGLLFAGSRTSAVANPIDDVLSFLGCSMVGK